VVQIDEPYLQARPEAGRRVRARGGGARPRRDRRRHGAAHLLRLRARRQGQALGYPFLRELDDCAATHVSLEAAQPGLDPEVLRELPSKTILLGVLDLGADDVETPEEVAARVRAALEVVGPERLVVAPDCGMKYLPREQAFRKLESMVAGARLAEEALVA
jgi:5-methyltetrahydropteroyltriglutamate--homocysteine methyltransferase